MKHLVLDIGGVFYRGWPDEAFWTRWSSRLGLCRAEIEAVLSTSPEHRAAQIGLISADEAFRAAGARLGIDGPLLRTLAEEAYLSDFDEALAEAARLYRSCGVTVSALTNSLSPANEIAARPEFDGVFDHVVSSHDVGAAKPDAKIFEALLSLLDTSPTDAVFVDDLERHVAAAEEMGFTALLFRGAAPLLNELARLYPAAGVSSRR